MFFQLQTLPYAQDALEPYISSQTISIHYGKHHATYLSNLNNLVEKNADLRSKSIVEIIKTTANKPEFKAIFNNAAQVWNHTFYWNCMTKHQKETPANGEILKKINEDFLTYENFIKEFSLAATSNFGSGWTWLIFNKNTKKLEILNTSNAETPISTEHLVPLLTIDVWEHAYYLNYQNRRAEYVKNFVQYLINWEFVNKNLMEIK